MSELLTNKGRADAALVAVKAFQAHTPTDDDDAIADLLCNLMHLSDARQDHDQMNCNFEAQLTSARMHYDAECVPRVQPGDRVRDWSDDTLRTVTEIRGECVYMADGGVMGLGECTEIYLESETPEREA